MNFHVSFDFSMNFNETFDFSKNVHGTFNFLGLPSTKCQEIASF